MKQYLCLGYYDPSRFDALSETEQEAIVRECRPHDEALHASGRLVSVASLHPAARWGEHLGFAVEVRPIEACMVTRTESPV